MKLFLWTRLDNVTDRYHPEGGLVVIAKDLDRAIELATNKGVSLDPEHVNWFWDGPHLPKIDKKKIVKEEVVTHENGKLIVNWNKEPTPKRYITIDERVPDKVFDIPDDVEEEVIIFEDAGCC